MPTAARIARFEAKTIPEPNTGCLLWLGSADKKGYGNFWHNGVFEKAHRFAMRCIGTDIPPGHEVCHRCDTPYCVNPKHLFVGTRRDNMADMVQKKRGTVIVRRGSAHPRAKLSDAQVAEIRAYAGGTSKTDLAASYGVDRKTIYNIQNGFGWTKPSGVELKPRSTAR